MGGPLTTDYSLRPEFLVPPCWPAHPGVCRGTRRLYRAWASSARADSDAGTAGAVQLAVWHDQWLWTVLRRIKDGRYAVTNCYSQGHTATPVRVVRTDRVITGRA